MMSCAMYGEDFYEDCTGLLILFSPLVSAVVIFFWIHSVFCCDPSKDVEDLSHIFQPCSERKGTECTDYCLECYRKYSAMVAIFCASLYFNRLFCCQLLVAGTVCVSSEELMCQ